jgi:hypothetical protein
VVAAVYPRPDYEGVPWSQWGQGVVVNGRFLSAIGDHCGVNGNSYFYDYDAAAARLRPAGDVLSLVEHAPGAWGYGKVHAQMVAGGEGAAYVTTYWGTKNGLAYDEGYEGDLLLRRDPGSGKWASLGVPMPGYGIPSLAGSAEHGLLYGEAVEPADSKQGLFFVFDLETSEVIFEMDKGDTRGYRSVLVDAEGRAHFSTGVGQLHVYDPETNEATQSQARLPGEWLRAASPPAPDGTVYGVTREPDTLFALRPTGEIDDLGPVRGYVASIALSPDGTRLFYVPDAHGRSWEEGTPLIAVDTGSGEESVVVELNDLAEERLDLRLGGSYSVVMDPGGERVYIGLNAGAPETGSTFGQVVLAVVDLP